MRQLCRHGNRLLDCCDENFSRACLIQLGQEHEPAYIVYCIVVVKEDGVVVDGRQGERFYSELYSLKQDLIASPLVCPSCDIRGKRGCLQAGRLLKRNSVRLTSDELIMECMSTK
jgi:hypothetical protein